jgi:hypothetical protein
MDIKKIRRWATGGWSRQAPRRVAKMHRAGPSASSNAATKRGKIFAGERGDPLVGPLPATECWRMDDPVNPPADSIHHTPGARGR